MRISPPPRPLPISEILRKIDSDLLENPQVISVLEKTRAAHLPWDKFRFQSLPPGSHEILWQYARWQRDFSLRALPLRDQQDLPFRFLMPPGSARLISQIDQQSAGSFISEQSSLPARERFVISSLMEEAISSSLLEGAQTTRVEAKKMLREGRAPRSRAERMVANNWATMEHILTLKNEPLSLAMLLDIQAYMTRDTLDDAADSGRLRTRDDIHVVDTRNEEIVHHPPPFAELPARLEQLILWANDDESAWIHPVIKASILHFMIGYEHPFVDGNGRTARALFYWFMLSRGYWLFEFLAISRFFLRAPAQYGRAYILSETDGNDVTYFLDYSLRAVELSLNEMHAQVNEKLFAKNSQRAQAPDLNARQNELLAHASLHPDAQYTFLLHQNLHRVTYQTARTDLLKLEERGYLKSYKQGNKFIFLPTK